MPCDRLRPDLLILGASTRAAAHSALRGGLRPICVDLFGDADLRSMAEVVTIDDYPADLPAIAGRLPACPWMYTGGLENHPRILARLAGRRPLLGNGPGVLARVRDPWWLSSQLRAEDLPAPETWPAGDSFPPQDGNWLRKPLRGAGGRGICVWSAASPRVNEQVYFQRLAAGRAYSALFLSSGASEGIPNAELLGVTRQLVGLEETHAPPFAWCGSLVPVNLSATTIDTMRRIGERLAVSAGLRGLFGCDFVVEGDVPILTEVNPRYTAAMELLDRQKRTSMIARHVAVCTGLLPRTLAGDGSGLDEGMSRKDSYTKSTHSDGIFGKFVQFADRDLFARDTTPLLTDPRAVPFPDVADVPMPGQRIPAGQPICTVFARELTEEGCLARLRERAHAFRIEYLRDGGVL